MNQIKQGTIIQWFDLRHFGFIEATNGKVFFFHIDEWNDDAVVPPTIGCRVEFEGVMAPKGLKALNVVPLSMLQVGTDALLLDATALKAGAEAGGQ